MVQHAKGTLTGEKGLRLSYGQWYPPGDPKAVVVLVHGIGEHMGRYTHVIDALTQCGYAVFGLDHRGHGESEGERACVERFDYYVDDLHRLVQVAQDAHDDLPLLMIGHSMGGLIATLYALRHGEQLTGLVLSGAAIQFGDDTNPLLKLFSGVVARLLGCRPLIPPDEENLLSRDPEVGRRFEADPLCYKGSTKARMAHEIYQASQRAQAAMHRLSLPLLVMHGTADRMTNPAGSQRLYDVAQSEDKTLKLWPDNYHEIFNELDKEAVISFMLDWLDAHVPETGAEATSRQRDRMTG